MLRLLLPPNLPAAAARNAVAVKLELDLAAAPPSELLPILAVLTRITGAAAPEGTLRIFLQLKRLQLRELIAAGRGQPVFFWAQQPAAPIPWDAGELVGVSDALGDPPAAANTPAAAPSLSVPRRPVRPAATPLGIDGGEHFLALTLPSPEHPSYAEALDLVRTRGFVLEPSNRKWWLRDRHKVLNLLAEQGTRLREQFGARFSSNFEKNTAHLRPIEIICAAGSKGADFDVTVALVAGPADEAQIRSAMAGSRGYLEVEGKIFLFDPERLRRVAEAQQALAGDPAAGVAPRRTQRVTAARVAELDAVLADLSPAFQPPAAWKQRSEGLRQLTTLPPAPVPAGLERQLRPYQRLGAAWLWYLYHQHLGGVLADEMGLGKTLQALALLAALAAEAPGRPSLVVCPASLLENWRREAARFAPDLRVFVHHGERRLTAGDFAAHDLVITSYGTLARDQELFAGLELGCVVADEAQHIKNRRSQNARTLRSLRAGGRFLLTGTPLENSLDDLRSLFEFLLPGYLDPVPAGTRGEDRRWYDDRLRAKTAPFILRRTKQAVAPELPEKIEQVLWCELGPAQAALYRAVQEKSERELFDLEAGGATEAAVRLAALTQLLRLRQICCDPRLLPESVAAAAPGPADSAKLDAFLELLDEAVDDGHRVLVFSQFTSLLALLRPELEKEGLAHCYLDGGMSPRARQAEVDRFQASSAIPIFLLSLKAGGTGLNLTGADTVVHYDPWWNPAVEAQATDRAHRIGQSRTVTSYKLIASGTVEEKVLGLQEEKRALLAGVFEASDAAAAKLSVADLKSLLKAR
jgi:superfamily II DNA or RNA helicase